MKKGQVWEGIVKEVDDREKYSAGTEDQIFSK